MCLSKHFNSEQLVCIFIQTRYSLLLRKGTTMYDLKQGSTLYCEMDWLKDWFRKLVSGVAREMPSSPGVFLVSRDPVSMRKALEHSPL